MNTDYRAAWLRAEQEIRDLEDERARLRQALRGVAWKDSAGLCWCPGETEFAVAHPGAEHSPRCIAAREALAGPDTPADSDRLAAAKERVRRDYYDDGGITFSGTPLSQVVEEAIEMFIEEAGLDTPADACGNRDRIVGRHVICDLPKGHDGEHRGQGARWLRADTPADSQECDHGITLANKQTGVERCAECGATVPADSQEDKT